MVDPSLQQTQPPVPDKQPTDWLILGLDGWLVSSVSLMLTIVVTIALAVWAQRRSKGTLIVNQERIEAKGNVAGGNINSSTKMDHSVNQKDIRAGGDVAGGDITK